MLTISVSWMWADLVFSSSQAAYVDGVAGMFWFAVPAFLCFIVYAFLAVQARKLNPTGFTMPELMTLRFNGDRNIHRVFIFITLVFQLAVLALCATISGFFFEAMKISYHVVAFGVIAMTLTYTLFRGLKASVHTNVLQAIILFVLTFVLLPWTLMKVDTSLLQKAMSGITQDRGHLLNGKTIWTFAIPMVVAQFTMPIIDQMFFQGAVILRSTASVFKTYTLAGLLAALSVCLFGVFGFIGVHLMQTGVIEVQDPQMAIVDVLRYLLPPSALIVFTLIFLACTFSTVDAIYCAISSLFSLDVYKKYLNPTATDKQLISAGRWGMVGSALIAGIIVLFKLKIFWMLFILGTIGASVFVPVFFALYNRRITASAVSWAIIIAFMATAPLSIYGNVAGNADMVVYASLGGLGISFVICLISLFSKR